MTNLRVGFCYNVKPEKPSNVGIELDYDAPETIAGIVKSIEANGHKVFSIQADDKAYEKLKKLRRQIDIVFNLAEGVNGDARESQIPIFCEMLGIPYTHSSPTVHALSLDKNLTKLAMAGAGVRVPGSLLMKDHNPIAAELKKLTFPLLLKPNKEGSSAGVFSANVVEDETRLYKRAGQLRDMKFGGDLLAEEFIDGREFTVAVWGNENPEVLPIVEQKFDFLPKDLRRIAGYELKWMYEDKLEDLTRAYDCPAKLNPVEKAEIEKTSILVYRSLGVRDIARIDYRMDRKGKLYFLEINTLPGMIPDEEVISYLPLSARKAGISFERLVGGIIELARKRYGL